MISIEEIIDSGEWPQAEKDWMSFLYAKVLEKKPKVIVEIGTGPGASTRAFAIGLRDSGGELLVSIDPGETERVFEAINSYGLNGLVRRIKNFSSLAKEETLSILEDRNINLLLIDGAHYYDAVLLDWDSYSYLVDGEVLFHDMHLYEVRQVFSDIARKTGALHSTWESKGANNQTGIIEVSWANSVEHWNKIYSPSNSTRNLTEVEFKRLAKRLPQGFSVLDVGCGLGHWLEYLSLYRKDLTLLGIDQSVNGVRSARERCPKARVAVMDLYSVERFPVRPDIITCFEVIEHLTNPAFGLQKILDFSKYGVIFSVPDDNGKGTHFEHVNHFDRYSVRNIFPSHYTLCEVNMIDIMCPDRIHIELIKEKS